MCVDRSNWLYWCKRMERCGLAVYSHLLLRIWRLVEAYYGRFSTHVRLVLSMLITIPIGLGCAVYLSEYAKPGILTSVVNMAVETLASLPSIVVGLFWSFAVCDHMGWG